MIRLLLIAFSAAAVGAALLAGAALAGFDPDFGENGRVMTDFAGGLDNAKDVVIQPDGKLVVAGSAGADIALARYHPDGRLDDSFADGGRQTRDLGADYANAEGIAVDGSGNIVVVGQATKDGIAAAVLIRYDKEGKLDQAFGDGGSTEVDFGAGSSASLNAVALDGQGRTVVSGWVSRPDEDSELAVARLDADGQPDGTFGTEGVRVLDIAGRDDRATTVGLDPSGKLVVAGSTETQNEGEANPQQDAVVARFTTDGTPDAGFSDDGHTTTRFTPGTDQVSGLAIQPDGKIVLAGGGLSVAGFIGRYDTDGSPDETFSYDGQILRSGGMSNRYNDVAIQSDGRIVVVGYASGYRSGDLWTDRYEGNGIREFSQDRSLAGSPSALALQPDGRVVVAGGTNKGDFLVLRHEFTRANLSVDISDAPDPARAGSALKYTARISNAGPDRAAFVRSSHRLPPGTDLISAKATQGSCSGPTSAAIVCALGTLGAGQLAEVELTVRPRESGTVESYARVDTETLEVDYDDNSESATTTVRPPPPPPPADLVLDIEARDSVRRGQRLTYFGRVRNAGPGVASPTTYKATLSRGQRFVAASRSCRLRRATRTVECSLGPMGAGVVRLPRIRVEAARRGSITLTGVVTSARRDPRRRNNREVEALRVR